MTDKQFIARVVRGGYADSPAAQAYVKEHRKPEYTEDDVTAVYRRYERDLARFGGYDIADMDAENEIAEEENT